MYLPAIVDVKEIPISMVPNQDDLGAGMVNGMLECDQERVVVSQLQSQYQYKFYTDAPQHPFSFPHGGLSAIVPCHFCYGTACTSSDKDEESCALIQYKDSV